MAFFVRLYEIQEIRRVDLEGKAPPSLRAGKSPRATGLSACQRMKKMKMESQKNYVSSKKRRKMK
jgi:hypothetical protein